MPKFLKIIHQKWGISMSKIIQRVTCYYCIAFPYNSFKKKTCPKTNNMHILKCQRFCMTQTTTQISQSNDNNLVFRKETS